MSVTHELAELFAKIGSQEDAMDPLVVARLLPVKATGWEFLATEYNPTTQEVFGVMHTPFAANWSYLRPGAQVRHDPLWEPKTVKGALTR